MRRFRLVPDDTHIPFFRYRWIAFAWSGFVLFLSVILVATVGLNLGIDFKGGILLEIRTPEPANLAAMRDRLGGLGLGDIALQDAGSDRDVMIRVAQPPGGEEATNAAIAQVRAALEEVVGDGIEYRRSEFVGPKVSDELFRAGIWAVVFSLGGVLIYLWLRFEWQYGIGAIASLVHDVSAAIGLYVLLQIEFNLTSIAAILTIVGYSLNDTVVIFDRVRENLRKYKALPIQDLLDRSINETLARTLTTSLTTLLALIPLWLFGGEVISGFTIMMIAGVIVGTYSTVYIAIPVLYYLNLRASAAKAQPAAPQPAE